MNTSNIAKNSLLHVGASLLPGMLLAAFTCALCVTTPLLRAQTYVTNTGLPSSRAVYPAEMGSIDAGSGNLHLDIPLGSFLQRRLDPVDVKLTYDSHIWTSDSDGVTFGWTPSNVPSVGFNGGWSLTIPGMRYHLATSTYNGHSDIAYTDSEGADHWFDLFTPQGGGNVVVYPSDASGLKLNTNGPGSLFQLIEPDGTVEYQASAQNGFLPLIEDSNGNYITEQSNPLMLTDTVGRTPLTLEGGTGCTFTSAYGSKNTYSTCIYVLNSEGSIWIYTVGMADILLKTTFQQNIPGGGKTGECTTGCFASVITNIKLPDNSYYYFTYDCDSSTQGTSNCSSAGGQSAYYGTLTSMTLPTGKEVTYGYSNFGGVSQGQNNNQAVSPGLRQSRLARVLGHLRLP